MAEKTIDTQLAAANDPRIVEGSEGYLIEVDGEIIPNYDITINVFSEGDIVTGNVVRIDKDEKKEIHDGCTTAGIGCIDCKKRFQANLMKILDPIRERYTELAGSRRQEVDDRLESNAAKCRAVAAATMLEVKEKMGLKKIWKVQS